MLPARAQTQGQLRASMSIGASPAPATPQPTPQSAPSQTQLRGSFAITDGDQIARTDQPLELEVFINNRPTNLVASFVRKPDGQIVSTPSELKAIGLKVPTSFGSSTSTPEPEIPLKGLPGVTYDYDENNQIIRISAKADAQDPVLINAVGTNTSPSPSRPPWGGTLNYSIFTSASDSAGGPRFEGLSSEFDTRLFGPYGTIENGVIGRTSGGPSLVRLDSSYRYEDPDGLLTGVAGDLISGGFSWTRPIRMLGLQIRRDFGLRPDLVTLPLPSINGTAAAPSMLDLYVNQVHTLSTDVPEGPYSIANPPIIYGSGQAQVVLRDALGRETVTSSDFYASPQLLAPGYDDYSAEIGLARRNYAVLSSDYDNLLAFSGSYRRGVLSWLTVQGHTEGAGSLVSAGGGGVLTVGNFGLVSIAASGSHAPSQSGGLFDVAFESRTPDFSFTLRAQRTVGIYQDLASWTSGSAPTTISERRIYGNPQELEQAAVAVPLQWDGASLGASFVQLRQANSSQSRIANLSFTQQFDRLTFFASYSRDFETRQSSAFFAGITLPLGDEVSASTGATSRRGLLSGYAEASKQGAQEPGAFGWAVRATEGDTDQAQGILRYGTDFANFEATGLYRDGAASGTGLVEGALTTVNGEIYASPPLTGSFAVVEAGAPGVTVLRENRVAGVTGADGSLLVPNLAAFAANRIAIDPADLPVDAEVSGTETTVTPYRRVAGIVNLAVKTDVQSALLILTDTNGKPLELGSELRLEGMQDPFTVGYDGQAFVEGLKDHNMATVTLPDGRLCRAAFAYKPSPGQQVRIGPLACKPST